MTSALTILICGATFVGAGAIYYFLDRAMMRYLRPRIKRALDQWFGE